MYVTPDHVDEEEGEIKKKGADKKGGWRKDTKHKIETWALS